MCPTAPRARAFLLLGVLLVAGCTGASVQPSASATTSAAASLQPLTREEAIAAARVFAGAATAVVVGAEAGPFAQFDASPNPKMSPPPAGHWVWHIAFRDSSGNYSDAIIDYVTGALVETSRTIAN
jgi:hypothetical protein